MTPRGHKQLLVAAFVLPLLTACGTSKADILQQQLQGDAPYYRGLHAIDNQDEAAALRLFREGKKKSSPLAARSCAEALTLIGNVQDRIKACRDLIRTYHDPEAMLVACRELYRENEYAEIISVTENIDFENDPNELIRIRLDSLYQKQDSRFEQDLYQWLICRPCGAEQLEVYRTYQKLCDAKQAQKQKEQEEQEAAKQQAAEEELRFAPADIKPDTKPASAAPTPAAPELTPKQQIMEFRITVYLKDFASAYRLIPQILSLCTSGSETPLFPQLISDMGKASLYGTENLDTAARRFEYIAQKQRTAKDDDSTASRKIAYYAHFYAARLYDKDGNYATAVKKHFIQAMSLADNSENYDNSLWYLLNCELRYSSSDVIDILKQYASTWHDPSYFDDIFDSLSVMLLTHQQWQDILTVWHLIDGYTTDETTGHFAYLSGRLLQEKLAEPDNGSTEKDEEKAAFTRALSSGSSYYYKILAAERLSLSADELTQTLLTTGTPVKKDINTDAEKLMAGYAAFGFPQKVYPEWLKYHDVLSTDSASSSAKFLQQCGLTENQYGVQSLRIASRTISGAGSFDRSLLELCYPRYFLAEVTAAGTQNDLSEYELLALIRSESFFDQQIISQAGATGLTQLMNSTAADVAKKLHVTDYDLQTPATNIQFGGYYLHELTTRLDNSPLLAIFSYNAGISHVRSWVKTIHDDYARTGKPMHARTGVAPDLFLEMLPFEETREYGKKIVSAAALYGWLYYDKSTNDIVQELMK